MRTNANDPPTTSAEGSESVTEKIIVTFHKGLRIRNNVDAALKLAMS